MSKQELLEELQELLEFDGTLSETSMLEEVDSMNLLSLMAFLDENFNIQKTAEELKKIKSVKGVIELIGKDNIS